MSYFLKSGNTFRVSSKEAMDLHDELPAGNYVIKKNDMTGEMYLEGIDRFEHKGKIYGDTMARANRILFAFNDRTSSTGVMLSGEKGSGKTLLAKTLAIMCADNGIPCIVINSPWRGDAFNKLLQDIEQPCMILFDEFEKVYDSDQQEVILTLLDGVFPSKKLFVLTCNDKWRIDSHMRNRPGRIFYMLDFKGLEDDFIREYCEDVLEDKRHTDKICQIAATFSQFNFDMLKALVEEMNRYNESPREALRMLNAKPEFSGNSKFKIEFRVNGKLLEDGDCEPNTWEGNPLMAERIHGWYDTDRDNEDIEGKSIRFGVSDLVSVMPKEGRFVYKQGEVEITFIREAERQWHWDAF